MTLEELFNLYPEIRVLIGLIVVVVAAVEYKIYSRLISRFCKRAKLGPHVQNSLRLILRVTIIVAVTVVLFTIYELPTTWFLGGSALIGAAIGFGASQTINNIVAGFYVIISRPFKVKDYVKIGDIEGQVEEISINYTRLYTPSFHLLVVPNVQIMRNRIVNCTHEGFIKYTFPLGFPHTISNEGLVSKCIEPAIEEFYKKHRDKQLRKPEYYFDTSTRSGRSFKIRIFIPKGEAKTLYNLQPELSDMIISRWDVERKRVPTSES